MANFRVYNIQLLPKTIADHEVGISGYKTLFRAFRQATVLARREKRLISYHQEVGKGTHFGPDEFHVKAGYVWGKFVRYRRTIKVDDLNTRKPIFKEGTTQVGVSNVNEMLFFFDCRDHFLAIEEAGTSLPPSTEFTRILNNYLKNISELHFPHHELHITLIADKKSLDMVLEKATGFMRIEVAITFPNGAAEDALEEVKRSRIHSLVLKGTPATGGEISRDLPPFLMGIIQGAIKYGRAKLTYLFPSSNGKNESERSVYDSATTPLKFEKRKGASESYDEFVERCVDDLRGTLGQLPGDIQDKNDDEENL